MKKFFNHRLGYAMAYHVVVLAAVAVPFLTLTTEITRALYVNVRIQTAVDAAGREHQCSSGSNCERSWRRVGR